MPTQKQPGQHAQPQPDLCLATDKVNHLGMPWPGVNPALGQEADL
jgi:hypothetical protein